MKYITTIILLLIFQNSFAQIELISRDKSYTIGQIKNNSVGVITLGYTEYEKENQYNLSVFRKDKNPCNKDIYNLKFNGTKQDLDLLYKLILEAYNQSAGAETEIKIGNKIVTIRTNMFKQAINNRNKTKNLHKDFCINGCTMFELKKDEVRELFSR